MLRRRSGFTLIELVVVILILGILAGVAAPKLFSTSGTATENGLKQTLSIIRDSIELFAADNGGAFPQPADSTAFHTLMKDYVRGKFPASPVGLKNNQVKIVTGASITADELLTGWVYNKDTGEFICNCNDGVPTGGGVTYDQL